MDLATLVGLVGALGIVLTAMLIGGSAGMYFNMPSVLIVFVGSIFVVLVKFNCRPILRRHEGGAESVQFSADQAERID